MMNLSLKIPFWQVLFLGGSLVLSSCQSTSSSAKPTPTEVTAAPRAESSDKFIYRPAVVETVRCQLITSKPPQALLTINGLLQDGATNLHEVKTTRVTGGFAVSVTTSRARDAMATLALVPYERIVPLDLTGVPSGPCQITVNGVMTDFIVP